jgi:hypothetical protein
VEREDAWHGRIEGHGVLVVVKAEADRGTDGGRGESTSAARAS